MMERRLLVGMAGIVLAVLCAFAMQATAGAQEQFGTAYGGHR